MDGDSPFMRPKLGKNCDGICVVSDLLFRFRVAVHITTVNTKFDKNDIIL